ILFVFTLSTVLCTFPLFNAPVSAAEIYIRPKISFLYPASSHLRAYFDRDMVFMYGGEIDLDPGIYFQLLRYEFLVDDPQESFSVSSIWYTLGIEKNFILFGHNFYGRLGLTYHSDELLEFNSESPRIGIQTVFGYNFQLSPKLQLSLEMGYEFESVKESDYLIESPYDRHQYYLSGRRFQTGGIFISTGLGFRIYKGKD
ncbi:MAG: hypothetical protein P8078_08355, partial [bacterium]